MKKQQTDNKSTIIIVGGLLAVAALGVIATSNCGVYLDFKMTPLPNVEIKKEVCPSSK